MPRRAVAILSSVACAALVVLGAVYAYERASKALQAASMADLEEQSLELRSAPRAAGLEYDTGTFTFDLSGPKVVKTTVKPLSAICGSAAFNNEAEAQRTCYCTGSPIIGPDQVTFFTALVAADEESSIAPCQMHYVIVGAAK